MTKAFLFSGQGITSLTSRGKAKEAKETMKTDTLWMRARFVLMASFSVSSDLDVDIA